MIVLRTDPGQFGLAAGTHGKHECHGHLRRVVGGGGAGRAGVVSRGGSSGRQRRWYTGRIRQRTWTGRSGTLDAELTLPFSLLRVSPVNPAGQGAGVARRRGMLTLLPVGSVHRVASGTLATRAAGASHDHVIRG